ncbi:MULTISPECIES: hypothetical protein [unclassified Ensifer]|uniref:hypothetical protein n=1 Tax=unclassified Ensifer TaxID=2633371 RepID=UPI0011120A55|nr:MULTISPECIES: hypothetical protein [unclassified Ensifer]
MAAAGQGPRRPRFTCMGLNAAGRPVPMFDPFFDGQDEVEEVLMPVGPLERLLFGERDRTEGADVSPMRRTTV